MADTKKDEVKSSTTTTPVTGSTHAQSEQNGGAGARMSPSGSTATGGASNPMTGMGTGSSSAGSSSMGSSGSSMGTGAGSSSGSSSYGAGSSTAPGVSGSAGTGGMTAGSAGMGGTSGTTGTSSQSSTGAYGARPPGGTATGAGQSYQPQGRDRYENRGATDRGHDTARPASRAASDARGRAGGAYEDARERAGEYYEEAKERAGEYYEEASDWARDKYEQAKSWAAGTRERGGRNYDYASRRARGGMNQAWSGTQRFVSENPVMVGVIGLAAGLLLGALLPRTRHEDRAFGEWSDDVRDQGYHLARDAVRRGRDYAEHAFTDDEPRYASHESEWRHREDEEAQAARRTSPVTGRPQSH